MSDLQQINLADLKQIYLFETEAVNAVQALEKRGADMPYMSHLLRHHEITVTDPEEINLREAFDQFMEFCALLEIAAIASYIPPAGEWPQQQRDSVLQALQHPAVRKFYENHYPLVLPQLLRRRLEGGVALVERGEDAPGLYVRLLDLNVATRPDIELTTFFRMLDQFRIGGYRISDLIGVLKDPDSFFDHIARPPSKRTPLEHGLRGLSRFLVFCDRLGGWLKASGKLPLLQSAGWHLYGYWFGIMRETLAPVLIGALDEFQEWEHRDLGGEDKFVATGPSLKERRANLERLMSDDYRKPLEEAMRPPRPRPKGPGLGHKW